MQKDFYRIIKIDSDLFAAETPNGRIFCRARKRNKKGEILVGDFVKIGDGVILDVLPRKNRLIRPPVANVDQILFVICCVPKPDYFLLDKAIVNCNSCGIDAAVCINKSDINDESFADGIKKQYSSVTVVSASALNREVGDVKALLEGKLTCLAGQSAVGKSSIVSALLDGELDGGLSGESGENSGGKPCGGLCASLDEIIADSGGGLNADLSKSGGKPCGGLCASLDEIIADSGGGLSADLSKSGGKLGGELDAGLGGAGDESGGGLDAELGKTSGKSDVEASGNLGGGTNPTRDNRKKITIKIGELSAIDRGRNTTTSVELYDVCGGLLADTPGFSLLDFQNIKSAELELYYPEFDGLRGECRYHKCTHVGEPDCAVRAAAANGTVNADRYKRYLKLFEQLKLQEQKKYKN